MPYGYLIGWQRTHTGDGRRLTRSEAMALPHRASRREQREHAESRTVSRNKPRALNTLWTKQVAHLGTRAKYSGHASEYMPTRLNSNWHFPLVGVTGACHFKLNRACALQVHLRAPLTTEQEQLAVDPPTCSAAIAIPSVLLLIFGLMMVLSSRLRAEDLTLDMKTKTCLRASM